MKFVIDEDVSGWVKRKILRKWVLGVGFLIWSTKFCFKGENGKFEWWEVDWLCDGIWFLRIIFLNFRIRFYDEIV